MLEVFREEHRPPAATIVPAQFQVVALSGHAGDNVANTALVIEATMKYSLAFASFFDGEWASQGRDQPAILV